MNRRSNGSGPTDVLLIATALDKTGEVAAVYGDVTSEVLDHTYVRGKMYPLALGATMASRW